MTKKVWFITGASRGFGRIWAEAALERGDMVAATARTLADIADLQARFGELVLPLALDVRDDEQVKQAVHAAHTHFGRLDVVLNNAGYPLMGMIEEVSLADVQAQFDTNVYGTLRVLQAALPLLRKQGHGHILGVSSLLGHVSLPLIGMYCASKWAFEAVHESLAQEVQSFGLKVTLLEPGAYATEFGGPASGTVSQAHEAYAGVRQQVMAGMMSMERGDPRATAAAVMAVVDSPEPPLRLLIGSGLLPWVRTTYDARLATWETWADVSNAAQGVAKVATP